MFTASARRPDGYARISYQDGPTVERDTLSCVHCGHVWEIVPGSGRKRGFCLKCMGATCGAAGCNDCIPLEARIEHMEGKQTSYDGAILDQFGRALL